MTGKAPHLEIQVKRGAWIDPAQFFRNIRDAGYQARKDDVRLTLTGQVAKQGDQLLFLLNDVKPGPQAFLLAPDTPKDPRERAAFTAAYNDMIRRVGQTVGLEALWKPAADKGGRATLLVRQIRPAPSTGSS